MFCLSRICCFQSWKHSLALDTGLPPPSFSPSLSLPLFLIFPFFFSVAFSVYCFIMNSLYISFIYYLFFCSLCLLLLPLSLSLCFFFLLLSQSIFTVLSLYLLFRYLLVRGSPKLKKQFRANPKTELLQHYEKNLLTWSQLLTCTE